MTKNGLKFVGAERDVNANNLLDFVSGIEEIETLLAGTIENFLLVSQDFFGDRILKWNRFLLVCIESVFFLLHGSGIDPGVDVFIVDEEDD